MCLMCSAKLMSQSVRLMGSGKDLRQAVSLM